MTNNAREMALSPKMKHHMNGNGGKVFLGWPPLNREQRRLAEKQRKRKGRDRKWER